MANKQGKMVRSNANLEVLCAATLIIYTAKSCECYGRALPKWKSFPIVANGVLTFYPRSIIE